MQCEDLARRVRIISAERLAELDALDKAARAKAFAKAAKAVRGLASRNPEFREKALAFVKDCLKRFENLEDSETTVKILTSLAADLNTAKSRNKRRVRNRK